MYSRTGPGRSSGSGRRCSPRGWPARPRPPPSTTCSRNTCGRLGVGVGVTELKFVDLQPVYQSIGAPGWSVRVQQASSPTGPFSGPGATGVPRSKKSVATPSGGRLPATFPGNKSFFLVGPPPVGNGDLVVLRPVRGLGHVAKFRGQALNRKAHLPEARGPQTKTKVATLSGMGFRDFFLPGPRAGNHKIRVFQGHFGLGRALALTFLPGSAQLFNIARSGRPDPHGREIAKYGGFRSLWPRTALGT